MKKQFLFLPAAVLALASCSQDEQLALNQGEAIDFRAAMGSRATETTTGNLSTIFVTAIDKNGGNYFSSEQFDKGAGNFFASANSYYWPGDDSELNFYAYAPSGTDLGGTLTITGANKTLAGFSPATNIAAQKDFVTCKTTGKKSTSETSGVALNFKHQLSQIEIQAKNTKDTYTYKVVSARICQPVSQATFNFDSETWNTSVPKTTYTVAEFAPVTLGNDPQKLMGTDGSAMLIPQQLVAWDPENDKKNATKGAYLAVKLQIISKSGARVFPVAAVAEYDWVAVPINTKWEAGKKYVYTLDFSNGCGKVDPAKPEPLDPNDTFNPGGDVFGGEPIKFTVDVSTWTETAQSVTM